MNAKFRIPEATYSVAPSDDEFLKEVIYHPVEFGIRFAEDWQADISFSNELELRVLKFYFHSEDLGALVFTDQLSHISYRNAVSDSPIKLESGCGCSERISTRNLIPTSNLYEVTVEFLENMGAISMDEDFWEPYER